MYTSKINLFREDYNVSVLLIIFNTLIIHIMQEKKRPIMFGNQPNRTGPSILPSQVEVTYGDHWLGTWTLIIVFKQKDIKKQENYNFIKRIHEIYLLT